MTWKGNDTIDTRMPIDIVTGAVARQVPPVVFEEAPDTIRTGLHLCVSRVKYMRTFSVDVNSFRANM